MENEGCLQEGVTIEEVLATKRRFMKDIRINILCIINCLHRLLLLNCIIYRVSPCLSTKLTHKVDYI